MDLALQFAIFRRLSGYPLDANGKARRDPTTGLLLNVDNSEGIVVPMALQPNHGGLTTESPDGLRLFDRGYARSAVRKVPVYLRGTQDRRFGSIYPSVSFHLTDETAGTIPWSYFEQIEMATGATETITNPVTGVTRTQYSSFTTRKRPGSWDLWFNITLWSLDLFEMGWMARQLRDMWDRQGTLVVDLADGTTFPVRYTFERLTQSDWGEPNNPDVGVDETEPASLRRDYSFRFETMTDNTVDGFGIHEIEEHDTLVGRILETQAYILKSWEDPPQGTETTSLENLGLEVIRGAE